MTSSTKQEVHNVLYRNTAKGGPSQGHRQRRRSKNKFGAPEEGPGVDPTIPRPQLWTWNSRPTVVGRLLTTLGDD